MYVAVCMHACIGMYLYVIYTQYACTDACMHMHMCIHACTYACIYNICMYVNVDCVCMYLCIYKVLYTHTHGYKCSCMRSHAYGIIGKFPNLEIYSKKHTHMKVSVIISIWLLKQ